MARKQTGKRKGGSSKVGRSRRKKDEIMSLFVRGKISGEKYMKAIKRNK